MVERNLAIRSCDITSATGTVPDIIISLECKNKVHSEVALLTGTRGLVIPKQDGKDRPLEGSREICGREILGRCPELLRPFELLHGNASHIWLHDNNYDWQSSLASEVRHYLLV